MLVYVRVWRSPQFSTLCISVVTDSKDGVLTVKKSRSFSLVRAFFYAAATLLAFCLVASGCKASKQPESAASSTKSNETIVVLRHSEKAIGDLGQLNCMGLNRSLVLP